MDKALASYLTKLQRFEMGKGIRPKAAPIAREYDINERTLQIHIKCPAVLKRSEKEKRRQLLTVAEENQLIERLELLDDWNVPADRDQVTELALRLFRKWQGPTASLGKHWYYNFRNCHKDSIRIVFCANKEKERYNAEDWEIINDNFIKVEQRNYLVSLNHFC